MQDKIIINEFNIEEMCRLAEDVMHMLYMEYCYFDEEGNQRLLPKNEEERNVIYDDPLSHLLYDLFRRGDKIEDVKWYTQKEIVPWIKPIIHKALQMFRKGTEDYGETKYVVAESVPDEYLISIFAREVRNMMMIFAGQLLAKE